MMMIIIIIIHHLPICLIATCDLVELRFNKVYLNVVRVLFDAAAFLTAINDKGHRPTCLPMRPSFLLNIKRPDKR